MLLGKVISLTAGERFDGTPTDASVNFGTSQRNRVVEGSEGASPRYKPSVQDAEDVSEHYESQVRLHVNILPIAIALAGLIFSNSACLANLVALLLNGLIFAQILDQRFAEASTKGEDYGANGKTIKPPDTKLLRPCLSERKSVPGSQILLPPKKPREPTRNDEELGDQPNTANFTRPQSVFANLSVNDTSHRPLRVREVYPSSTLLPAQDDSDSSEGDSSKKSDETNITVPNIHGNPDRVCNTILRRQYVGPRGEDLLKMEFEERFERIKQIWKEDPTWDFGLFDDRDINNALYRGSLDAARMRRLKVGLQRLLASLDDRFADFDGLTLSDV
ncbi:MAG: hypothetical protein Q9184_005038 [Pyrenodesmia sp. 2 TL-2023]